MVFEIPVESGPVENQRDLWKTKWTCGKPNGGSTADIWSNAHAHVEQVVYRSHFSPGFLLIVVKGLRRHVLGCSTLMSAMGYLLQHVVTKDVTSNVRLSNLCITNNLSHNL